MALNWRSCYAQPFRSDFFQLFQPRLSDLSNVQKNRFRSIVIHEQKQNVDNFNIFRYIRGFGCFKQTNCSCTLNQSNYCHLCFQIRALKTWNLHRSMLTYGGRQRMQVGSFKTWNATMSAFVLQFDFNYLQEIRFQYFHLHTIQPLS